jgi:mono/diheme cytochrome c family protein
MADHPEPKAEIDFRDLLRKPEKLFGYGYIYFLIGAIALGALYVKELTTLGKNSVAPVAIADSSALIQDIPFIAPSIVPPVDVTKAAVSSEETVARGRELFRANCTSCHGEAGMGDGPSAATLIPKPRNFLSLAGWKNGSKVSQIYRTLQEGIPRSGMASYGYLPPMDRFALAHYIRTLTAGHSSDTPEDLQGLEAAYQLSKGVNRGGQIPIRKVERLVIAEQTGAVQELDSLLARINTDPDASGASLFRRLADNEHRAVISLVIHGRAFSDADDFVNTVSQEPLLFGLRPDVTRLSTDDWNILFDYVSRLRKAS